MRTGFVFEQAPFAAAHASTIAETAEGLVVARFGGPYEGHSEVGICRERCREPFFFFRLVSRPLCRTSTSGGRRQAPMPAPQGDSQRTGLAGRSFRQHVVVGTRVRSSAALKP